ncbi:hypothetical protein SpCBS45565_g07558 [Spizellomyces sp. 'palustris']|nr:hypothetical protein SpCBS45565_g07558 [Spizellomyces sp. 'palustris']
MLLSFPPTRSRTPITTLTSTSITATTTTKALEPKTHSASRISLHSCYIPPPPPPVLGDSTVVPQSRKQRGRVDGTGSGGRGILAWLKDGKRREEDGRDKRWNELTFRPLPQGVSLQSVQEENVHLVRQINSVVFPVRYNDKFYREVAVVHPKELSCLAFYHNTPIGAICCRKEPISTPEGTPTGLSRIYIMTLGVLSPYRRLHIGSALLNQIVRHAVGDVSVEQLCLHVQTTNEEALRFYERHGFEKVCLFEGYYARNRGVVPPDAWFLRRKTSAEEGG